MANADRILVLKLLGDVAGINKSITGVHGRMAAVKSDVLKWTKAFALDAVITGVHDLEDAVGDAFAGWQSGVRVADQMATTWKNLGLEGDKLDETLKAVTDSTLALGTSDDEAVAAFTNSIKNTHDYAKSLDYLHIAQDLVANGSAPDLASAFKIVQLASEGSAKTVHKFGLTSNTAAGRVAELGKQVAGAAKHAADLDPLRVTTNLLKEDLEKMVGSLATGDLPGAIDAIAQAGEHLSAAWDGLFPKVAPVLDKLSGGSFSGIASTVGSLFDKLSEFGDKVGPEFAGFVTALQSGLGALGTAFTNILTFVQPVTDILGDVASGSIGVAIDVATGIIDTFVALLNGDLDGALTAIQTTVGNVVTSVQTAFDAVLATLQGILPGIAKAAFDVGDGIFWGIINGLSGLAQSLTDVLVGAIRGAINALIGAWNQLDLAIPKWDISLDTPAVKIPGTDFQLIPEFHSGPIQVFGGTGDLVPDISPIKFAEGGIVRGGRGGVLGLIGEGMRDEAVIPLDRHGGGMGDTYHLAINFNGLVTDPVATGREVERVLALWQRRSGGLRLSLR